MKKKIAINGFGRIGRLTLRNLLNLKNIEVVGINDLAAAETLAHLFKYDSAQGIYDGDVSVEDGSIVVNDHKIKVFAERDPKNLPWKDLEVDIVLECTGIFITREKASMHIEAGAKRVILSAPGKGGEIPTIVCGINDDKIASDETIISNASCTTNCLAPVFRIIHDNWTITRGFMSTVHAYTGNQRIHDSPHSDLRRGRAAARNMIPTTTGAAKAMAKVIPESKGLIHATSIRVPVLTGSMIELYCEVETETNAEEVNKAFKNAAENAFKGILSYNEAPIVSSDIVSNKHSCIFDAPLTTYHKGMVKVTAWYDNEAGYSARLAELAASW